VEKFEVGIEKNKLRRRRNVVEKSQSSTPLTSDSSLSTTDMGRKLGACMPPFLDGGELGPQPNVAWAAAYLLVKFHLDPSNRLATIHQRYMQTDRQDSYRQDRQRSELPIARANRFINGRPET